MLFETCSDFHLERILIFSLFDVFWQLPLSIIISNLSLNLKSVDKIPRGGGADSHMKQTGMLVGNFEFNP